MFFFSWRSSDQHKSEKVFQNPESASMFDAAFKPYFLVSFRGTSEASEPRCISSYAQSLTIHARVFQVDFRLESILV